MFGATIFLKLKEIGTSIITSKIFLWVAVLTGAYLIFKGVFKKDKFENISLPDSGSGLPKGWGTQQAKLIASEGWDVIDGFFDPDTAKETWAVKCMVLSDDQLTLVYNAYNDSYGRADGNTLTEAMLKEWITPGYGGETDWKKLITRLKGLKLY